MSHFPFPASLAATKHRFTRSELLRILEAPSAGPRNDGAHQRAHAACGRRHRARKGVVSMDMEPANGWVPFGFPLNKQGKHGHSTDKNQTLKAKGNEMLKGYQMPKHARQWTQRNTWELTGLHYQNERLPGKARNLPTLATLEPNEGCNWDALSSRTSKGKEACFQDSKRTPKTSHGNASYFQRGRRNVSADLLAKDVARTLPLMKTSLRNSQCCSSWSCLLMPYATVPCCRAKRRQDFPRRRRSS